MAIGVVKSINPKGFGFVRVPGEVDVFFHCSQLQGLEFDERLIELRVEFELTSGLDGRPRAKVVRKAN